MVIPEGTTSPPPPSVGLAGAITAPLGFNPYTIALPGGKFTLWVRVTTGIMMTKY